MKIGQNSDSNLFHQGSVVVIISALIMWQTEWEYKIYVDPALSLLLVCIMMKVGAKIQNDNWYIGYVFIMCSTW